MLTPFTPPLKTPPRDLIEGFLLGEVTHEVMRVHLEKPHVLSTAQRIIDEQTGLS